MNGLDFYIYISIFTEPLCRLRMHSVLHGYKCISPGEPQNTHPSPNIEIDREIEI